MRPVVWIGLLGLASASCSPRAPDKAQTRGDHVCGGVFARDTLPAIRDPKLKPGSRTLCLHGFGVLHSGVTRTPLWSAEHLTRVALARARARDIRDDRFHAEARLPRDQRAETANYAASGYDRGHMTPSGDMIDAVSDHDSFSLANVVPQNARLNRGGWSALEAYVRSLATRLGDTYVVTGPLFEGAAVRRIGGRVLVPSSTWKAVWVPGRGAGAWIASNEARAHWQVVSIATLALRTGVDPFPALAGADRDRTPSFPTFGGAAGHRHGRKGS